MNERKISFITCVNDEGLYATCESHIQSLSVPLGYTVELLPIRGATSMAQGYNVAMQSTDAKYKVYLHQDTLIVNLNFIVEIITLFKSDPRLGLIGMAGCTELQNDGIWWNGGRLVGKVIEPTRVLEFSPVQGSYEPVAAVDGLLLATQYDVLWREDLFHGFHFYDLAQSLEVLKHGWFVGVPNQQTPWCKHGFGRTAGPVESAMGYAESFERSRQIFINHYLH